MTDETLFELATDALSRGDLGVLLDELCADDVEQRRRVLRLLAAHARAGEFLSQPASARLGALVASLIDPPTEITDPRAAVRCLSASSVPGAIGRLGHYEVQAVIGTGGFGTVMRATDDKLKRTVAIKVMSPELAMTSPARKRFLREAQAGAAIGHENVVRIYAVEEEPTPHLVMEYIPGITVQQRIEQVGPLELPEILSIGRQIASGLAAAHEKGLIHRDIKPANILLEMGPPLKVRITDFGLARTVDDASLTQSGAIIGTPLFMSPEQASGDPISPATDLFSLGSVLYTMTTGRPPFRAETSMAVMKRVIEQTARPMREVVSETPEWWCDIVAKLHAKDPRERFGSAAEVAALLDRCATALAQNRPVAPAVGRNRRVAHVRRAVVARIAAATLAVVAVAVAWWVLATLWNRDRPDPGTGPGVDPDPVAVRPPAPPAPAAPPIADRILPKHGWVSLMPALDPTADHVGGRGSWTRDGDALLAHPDADEPLGNAVRLRLPIQVDSSDYELEVTATRLDGPTGMTVDFPILNRGLSYTPFWRDLAGFTYIDGRELEFGTPTTRLGKLESGQPLSIRLRVTVADRRASVSAQLNGEEKPLKWDGPVDSAECLSGLFRLGCVDVACAADARYRVQAVRVRSHAGDILLTRPTDATKLRAE